MMAKTPSGFSGVPKLMQLGAEVTKICRKSTLREASYIPQPLLLRTVSDLRVPYALQPASNGLLPFWEKGLGDEGKTYKSGMHSVTSCPAGVGKN